MDFILAALLLGLAGSLHCIGMCGPLMLALPESSHWATTRLLHQAGRLTMYALFGALMGAFGQTLIAVGLQQWLAVLSGVLMLLFLAWPAGMKMPPFAHRWTTQIKRPFHHWMTKKTKGSFFMLGVLNGILPCGLVYMALSASLAVGSIWKGALFMWVFGLATAPALLAVSGLSRWIKSHFRWSGFRVVRISLAFLAVLMILRGANLGIPYLSPKMHAQTQELDCCKKK
jgi:uncharacterized protein